MLPIQNRCGFRETEHLGLRGILSEQQSVSVMRPVLSVNSSFDI